MVSLRGCPSKKCTPILENVSFADSIMIVRFWFLSAKVERDIAKKAAVNKVDIFFFICRGMAILFDTFAPWKNTDNYLSNLLLPLWRGS